jgi:hypothetical protein
MTVPVSIHNAGLASLEEQSQMQMQMQMQAQIVQTDFSPDK